MPEMRERNTFIFEGFYVIEIDIVASFHVINQILSKYFVPLEYEPLINCILPSVQKLGTFVLRKKANFRDAFELGLNRM